MAKEFKLNRTLKFKISVADENCKFNTKFAYVANPSSTEKELDELQSHLKNIKYFLNMYGEKSCTLIYNGYALKVYKFSLTFDSMEIYVKEKYYQISNKQFDKIYSMYNSLHADYIARMKAENERLEKETEKVVAETEKIQAELDKMDKDSLKRRVRSLLFNSYVFSIGFIVLSYFFGQYNPFRTGEYSSLFLIPFIAIYGLASGKFIIEYLKSKNELENV